MTVMSPLASDGACRLRPAAPGRPGHVGRLDRRLVIVEAARRQRAVQPREDPGVITRGVDDEAVDLAVAGRDEDADAGRIGALVAVGRGVAERRLLGAERARDERGRAAAVEVQTGLGAERDEHVGGLLERRARDLGLTAVGDISSNIVLPPSLKPIAVRGATDVSPCAKRDTVGHERLVGADRPLHLLGGGVLEGVAQRHRVAGLERLDRVGGGVAADEVVRAGRDRARAGRRIDRDDLVVGDQDLGDVGHARHAATANLGAPRRGVGDHAVGGSAAGVRGVDPDDRPRRAVQRGGCLQRHVDELADAALADADVCPAPDVGALDQRAVLDLSTDRRLRAVDVEEVAVDAGRGTGAIGHRRQHLTLGDVRRRQEVRLDRAVGEVDGQDLLVVPAARVEELLVIERDARADRLGLVDQRELIGSAGERRCGQGQRGRGDERTQKRARTGFGHPGSLERVLRGDRAI